MFGEEKDLCGNWCITVVVDLLCFCVVSVNSVVEEECKFCRGTGGSATKGSGGVTERKEAEHHQWDPQVCAILFFSAESVLYSNCLQ